jgi:hypothetical protein
MAAGDTAMCPVFYEGVTQREEFRAFLTALIMLARHVSMGAWKNEDDIKAELRTLTGELKHLREELRNMVSPPKPNPSRAFLHRQTWPPESKPATAAERGAAPRERPPTEKRPTEKKTRSRGKKR